MISSISKTSTFNKFLIFLVISISLLVAIVLFYDKFKEFKEDDILRSQSYYRDNVKELGTTMRRCDEAKRDGLRLSSNQLANCKTARKLHTEYVGKALYNVSS